MITFFFTFFYCRIILDQSKSCDEILEKKENERNNIQRASKIAARKLKADKEQIFKDTVEKLKKVIRKYFF